MYVTVDCFIVDEYQELTEREQEDLEKLLKEEEEKCSDGSSTGIQDIEAFTEHLSQQLAQLDDANIHTLMDSETQIHSLMSRIDLTLLEIKVHVHVLLISVVMCRNGGVINQ